MILRFLPGVPEERRAAVAAVLEEMDVDSRSMGGMLLLDRDLSEEESIRVAALEGVESLAPSDPATVTVRENFLRWTAGAALVMAVLVLVAANLPARLGPPADPLVTPGDLLPAWPMLAWYSLVNRLPAGVPVPLLVLAAAVLLVAWPFVARRFAEKRPLAHGILGALILAAGLVLSLLELTR